MKKVVIIISSILVVLLVGFFSLKFYYNYELGPVSSSDKTISVEVKQGDNYYTIGSKLYKLGLIKNEKIYKIYLKINKPSGLEIGKYNLKPNMGVEKIIDTLSGKAISTDIVITFKEGKNIRNIAYIISQNTNNSEQDVYNLLKDKNYLNELIEEYWFIDKSILNDKIYYPLEGYLYPNTYNFKDKNVTVKEIFKAMLDETNKQLSSYKSEFENSKYSVHQILTLASIVELEASKQEYRSLVASVFYNRLKAKMSLGSDVTTYYAAKVDMSERDLYKSEIDDVNAYNTRPLSMAGKLPIGPICNPSISSITASLKPTKTDYLFFVADNQGKIYFTRTNKEHEQTIARLQSEGLWERY